MSKFSANRGNKLQMLKSLISEAERRRSRIKAMKRSMDHKAAALVDRIICPPELTCKHTAVVHCCYINIVTFNFAYFWLWHQAGIAGTCNLVQFHLRLDGTADDLWPLAGLPQRDGQVFGSVGLQQRNFGRSFLRKLLSGQRQVHSWTLSLGLKHFLELLHVQVLRHTQVIADFKQVKSFCQPWVMPLAVDVTCRMDSSSMSLKMVPFIWLGFRATQFSTGILNLVWIGFFIFTAVRDMWAGRHVRRGWDWPQIGTASD